VIITTHARELADLLCEEGAKLVELELASGATMIR
jgi:hypothetical protein